MSKNFPLKKDQLKTLGLVALMIAGYVMLVHLPGAQRRTALTEQIRLAEAALAEDSGLDLEAMRADAQQAQAELEADERPLPDERDVFRVLDGVSGSLLARGISNHELTQGDPRRYRDYTLQPISLEFQGGFADAFAALQQVETMRYPVRIDRLEMIGDTEDARGEVLTVVQLGAFVDEEADDE